MELDAIFDFIREIDKEKSIYRQTYLADGSRKENDSEHAWHAALMVILLSKYSNEEIDVLKTVTMLLIHDIVEIDAGDTYAFDKAGRESAHEREEAAAKRIFGLLPAEQGQYLKELWEEFEAYESPEAKFAHAMDNIQPATLNAASGGKSWKEHQVQLSWLLERNKKIPETSDELWSFLRYSIFQPNIDNGNIIDDTK